MKYPKAKIVEIKNELGEVCYVIQRRAFFNWYNINSKQYATLEEAQEALTEYNKHN